MSKVIAEECGANSTIVELAALFRRIAEERHALMANFLANLSQETGFAFGFS
jgi:hypothetical protein